MRETQVYKETAVRDRERWGREETRGDRDGNRERGAGVEVNMKGTGKCKG